MDQKHNTIMPVWFLEGNIGRGKTTLLKAIETFLLNNGKTNIKVVYEPVEIWQKLGVLEKYYQDQKRWAYLFQNMAFITKIMELQKLNEPDTIYLVERSPMTDRNCFAELCLESGFISPMEWEVYIFWYNHFISTIPHSGFIYLESSPEICMKQIIKRNRGEESGIKMEYLAALHQKHEQWLRNTSSPIMFIPDEYTLENINDVVLQIMQFIEK